MASFQETANSFFIQVPTVSPTSSNSFLLKQRPQTWYSKKQLLQFFHFCHARHPFMKWIAMFLELNRKNSEPSTCHCYLHAWGWWGKGKQMWLAVLLPWMVFIFFPLKFLQHSSAVALLHVTSTEKTADIQSDSPSNTSLKPLAKDLGPLGAPDLQSTWFLSIAKLMGFYNWKKPYSSWKNHHFSIPFSPFISFPLFHLKKQTNK